MYLGLFVLVALSCYSAQANDFSHELITTLQSVTPPDVQKKAVEDLVQRLLTPDQARQIQVVIGNVSQISGVSWGGVVVENNPSGMGIKITGQTGVYASYGLNRYLRSYCNFHVSWDGIQKSKVPDKLPLVKSKMILSSIRPLQYFGNVCTASYSMVWWDWPQWERFIDWMAMNGFNLPLSHTGLESVWAKAWLKLGLTWDDINEHFTGPAFFAWNRMGNLKGWGGPLSKDWLDMEEELQKRIVARETELGMLPVLAGFAGLVPAGLKRVYPNSNITQVGCWLGFQPKYTCIDFLDPTDPLFQTVAATIMNETKASYGLYHFYSADPWNEQKPTSFEHDYLSAVGHSIYTGMQQIDPDAIWVLQAWMFINDPSDWLHYENAKTLLHSVPQYKLLLLDLYSEQIPVYTEVEGYYGQPYIWNMLHNFGGKSEMRGSAQRVNKGVSDALAAVNGTDSYVLLGTGLTMEGLFQNYAIYQFAIDRFWSLKELDMEDWVTQYATERYGRVDQRLAFGWKIVWDTLYAEPTGGKHQSHYQHYIKVWHSKGGFNYLYTMPQFGKKYEFWYDPPQICNAWNYFVQQSLFYYNQHNDLLEHDLVDMGREVLGLIGLNIWYPRIERAYNKGNFKKLQKLAEKMDQLFTDLDKLLMTDRRFMLGSWIKSARNKAINSTVSTDADQYEYNWRNQLTMWGPRGEINDYARKEWAGMVKQYYGRRWSHFFADLEHSVVSGTNFTQRSFNSKVVQEVEKPFTLMREATPIVPEGNVIDVSFEMYNKYFKICKRMSAKSEDVDESLDSWLGLEG